VQVGSLASTKVGFYGATPITQPDNGNLAQVQALTGGVLIGSLSTTLSPASITATNIASQVLTVTGSPSVSSDVIVWNKLAAQAGLGIVGTRAGTTAGTVIVDYLNLSSGTITPTAAESAFFLALRNMVPTVTITPTAVPPNSTSEQVFSVSGTLPVAQGQCLYVAKPTSQQWLGVVGARVADDNQIAITFMNVSSAAITPTAGEAYNYIGLKTTNPVTNTVVYGINVGTLAAVTTATAPELAVTATTTVVTTDFVLGATKPTAQAGLGIVGARVSSTNVLGIQFVNPTGATVTPTASEIYQVPVIKSAAPIPLKLFSATITPAEVGPNTTVTQAFTVTETVNSGVMWVNKPSHTVGIGIAGVRRAGANSVEITYANNTTVSITPPAEAYVFCQSLTVPAAGHYIANQIPNGAVQSAVQGNQVAASLASLGLIATV
jgi:hypothetical protein